MKIEIKLDDYKFCDGCPCVKEESFYGDIVDCHLNFDNSMVLHKNTTGKEEDIGKTLRPEQCIKENGK